MQALIIFLETHLENPPWILVDATGQILPPDGMTLNAAAEDREVIVVVPAQDVLLTTANLPKMSRSRLLQALPYVVEEQLIDEIDHLHFAAADGPTQGSLHIAIVAKDKMQHWLGILSELGIQPDQLISAVACLPITEETWHVLLTETVATVRTELLQGFACDRMNIPTVLSMAIAAASNPPKVLHFHNYTAVPCETSMESRPEVKEVFLKAEQFYSDCARNVLKTPSINVLQGAFAPKKKRLPHKQKILKATVALATSCVLLLFLYPIVSHFILQKRVDLIDAQMNAIYKSNFPQSSSVVAPRHRLEEKLRKLSSQMGENRFLQILAFLIKSTKQVPQVNVDHLDFQNNQLTLEIVASSSEEFSRFTELLQAQGLSVKQQNANVSGTRITASLLIE